jgi:chromosome segregation ATPase
MSLGEASATDTLGGLQGKGDKYTKLALIEKKKMTDLEDAISYIIKETESYREKAKKAAIDVMNVHVLTPNPAYQRADGVNIAKEAQTVTTKSLHILEAKVNKLLQKNSELQNKIKLMKHTINHFRLVRLQTDDAHKRYEETLAQTKEKIELILADSTKVIEERDRIIEKKEQLEKLNLEEQTRFQEEYEEMGKFIKMQNDALELALLQERKADQKGAGMTKKPPSPRNGNETTNTNNNNNTAVSHHMTSDMSLEQELEMAKKVGNLNTFLTTEQSSLQDLKEKILLYESMFEQLKKMTGVESLEEMVSNYIAHEEEMFSLYNFIQTVNTEIDTITESSAQTEAAISKFKEDQQDQDQQRRTTIDDLQQRLANMLETTRELVDQNAMQQESISQISKKVSSVFFKLQCDQMDAKGSQVSKSQRWSSGARPDNKIALLTSQGVTESNVLDYLGCIEQRAVDIISEYLRMMSTKEAGGNNNPAANNANMNRTLLKSPTPGPSTPMNWQRREPLVEIGDLSDDEFLQGIEAPPINAGNATNSSAFIETAAMVAGNTDNDNKPVDLSLFKTKLQRKLGIKESTSTPLLSGTGKRKPLTGTSTTIQHND